MHATRQHEEALPLLERYAIAIGAAHDAVGVRCRPLVSARFLWRHLPLRPTTQKLLCVHTGSPYQDDVLPWWSRPVLVGAVVRMLTSRAPPPSVQTKTTRKAMAPSATRVRAGDCTVQSMLAVL